LERVVQMNNNEKNYLNSIIQAISMVKKGIIEIDEFKKIEAKLAQKYCIKKTNLYRSNDWINT